MSNGDIQLSWSSDSDPAEHRAALERLRRDGKRAWIRLDSALAETRFRLNFAERTFSEAQSRETIQPGLRHWLTPTVEGFDRVYLLAEPSAKAPCYDITGYIHRCLAGDLSIAERLKGRTVFRLYQRETEVEHSRYDLLSALGTEHFTQDVLNGYLHQFGDFLERPIVGFCCELPEFLSPFIGSPPWSPELSPCFQMMSEPPLLDFLPFLFYETYDSATIRSQFWSGLTQHFAKVCIGGIRQFCRQRNLQFALNIPANAAALEVDIGTLLKGTDQPILCNPARSKKVPPAHFLITKWVASRSDSNHQVGICHENSISHEQYAFESVIGFNSWIFHPTARLNDPTAQNLGRFLSFGAPKRPILMIAPTHSLWTKPDRQTWAELTEAWGWLSQTIWELGYDFDIISEIDLIEAEVDKKTRTLQLNGSVYQVVALPSCLSLQEATVERLTEFVKAKGRLVALDSVPYLLNGRIGLDPYPLERLLYHWRTEILQGTPDEKTEHLKRLLNKRIQQTFQIFQKPDNDPADAIRVHHRQSEELELFYLFNSGESPLETLIEMQGEAARVEEWNPTTGEQSRLDAWHANGNTFVNRSFHRQQGRLIVSHKKYA